MRGLAILISFSFLSTAQTSPPSDWKELLPAQSGAVVTDSREAAYTYKDKSSTVVIAHYEETLHGSGIDYHTSFNGIGTTIQAITPSETCIVRVNDLDGGSNIHVSCSPTSKASPSQLVIEPPVPSPPSASATAAQIVSSGHPTLTAVHRVEYSLDGTAGTVGLTYRNPSGGTEQREVKVPGSLSFNAPSGQFVYFSAQNKSGKGSVRVRIRIDGRTLQEAATDSPYGIATSSGSVPK